MIPSESSLILMDLRQASYGKWKRRPYRGHIRFNQAIYQQKRLVNTYPQPQKKLEYPLPALTLSKKECGEIIKTIKDVGLPHYSICRNFPLNLVHRKRDYLGIGIGDLYIMHGSSQIEIVHVSYALCISSILLITGLIILRVKVIVLLFLKITPRHDGVSLYV